MKKRYLYILILILLIFTLSSCDEVSSLMSLVPKFERSLPNNIAGKYAYYSSEENKEANEYTTLYTFSSKEGTFTKDTEDGVKEGAYSVEYKTYAITECNGTITLTYENKTKEEYEFYFYATATKGPEYIMLGSRTYYYEGL